MSNVIEFRRKPKAPYPDDSQPNFVIEIYEHEDGSGFDWVVTGDAADVPPDEERLSDYLADMFFTLNPEAAPRDGILSRAWTFIRNLFTGDDK